MKEDSERRCRFQRVNYNRSFCHFVRLVVLDDVSAELKCLPLVSTSEQVGLSLAKNCFDSPSIAKIATPYFRELF